MGENKCLEKKKQRRGKRKNERKPFFGGMHRRTFLSKGRCSSREEQYGVPYQAIASADALCGALWAVANPFRHGVSLLLFIRGEKERAGAEGRKSETKREFPLLLLLLNHSPSPSPSSKPLFFFFLLVSSSSVSPPPSSHDLGLCWRQAGRKVGNHFRLLLLDPFLSPSPFRKKCVSVGYSSHIDGRMDQKGKTNVAPFFFDCFWGPSKIGGSRRA